MGTTRILAVEDNPADFRLLTEYLRDEPSAQFEAVCAGTLKEALGFLAEDPFAAVLLDLNLPDGSGLDVLDRVIAASPATAIIVLTGLDNEAAGLDALSRGAQDYLVKGKVNGDALIRCVRYSIERKKAEEAARQINAELGRRTAELERANEDLKTSRRAALNLMEEALEARRQAEQISAELARGNSRLDLLAETAGALLKSEDPRGVVERLCRKAITVLDCDVFFNYLLDAASGRLRLNACAGIPDEQAATIEWLDLGVAVCGCAARDGVRIVAERISSTPDPRTERVKVYGVKAYACHPLLGSQGEILGTLSFGTRARDTFSDEDLTLMQAVSDHVATAMIRMKAETAIARAKDEWERTFNSVPDLIALLDERHRVVRVNRAMAERLGTTPEACVGLPCYGRVHGTESPPHNCPHARTLADGQEHSAEIHESGLNADFLVSTTPLHDTDGRMTGAVHVMRDITRQKLAEARAREALALASASQTAVDVLETMGEGVLLLDMQGHITSVNPALERMTGIPAADVLGRPVRDIFPKVLSPEDAAAVVSALDRALKGASTVPPPLTLLGQTGRRTPVVLAVTFVRDQRNRPTTIVVTLRDISALRDAQRSLEQTNALLERIFDDTHVLLAYLDPALNFVRVNRAYAEAGRKDAASFVGKNHFALYPHAENEAVFRRVLETGEPLEVTEKPFAHPDQPERGTTYWDWSLQPVREEDGRIDGLLLCMIDVTRRVKARHALVESERKYRELVENAGSIIMRITPEYDITFFNEYAERFFGYEKNEVLGRNMVGIIVPEVDSEGRDLRRMVRDFMAQPDAHASYENENMCKGGRRVWVHWANRAVRDGTGHVKEILCVGTDITEHKQMEKEREAYRQRLRELADRLAATEEQERRRVATQIHDTIIQTLSLSSIRLGSLRKAVQAAGLAEHGEKVDQVRGLLDTGIAECRGLMAALTPPLLYELGLGPALRDFAEKQQKIHGIRIEFKEHDRPKPLDEARRGLLFQTARELVANAVKHAKPKRIRISLSCDDQHVCLLVRDTGRGFDPARLEGPVIDFAKGGYGLFHIRERLRVLGGHFDLDSAPGKGTTVTVRMPVA